MDRAFGMDERCVRFRLRLIGTRVTDGRESENEKQEGAGNAGAVVQAKHGSPARQVKRFSAGVWFSIQSALASPECATCMTRCHDRNSRSVLHEPLLDHESMAGSVFRKGGRGGKEGIMRGGLAGVESPGYKARRGSRFSNRSAYGPGLPTSMPASIVGPIVPWSPGVGPAVER